MTHWQLLLTLADKYGYMMTDEDETSLRVIAHILKQTQPSEVQDVSPRELEEARAKLTAVKLALDDADFWS